MGRYSMSMRKIARISNVEYQTVQRNVHVLLNMLNNEELNEKVRKSR